MENQSIGDVLLTVQVENIDLLEVATVLVLKCQIIAAEAFRSI
jgi:hypothetical protein